MKTLLLILVVGFASSVLSQEKEVYALVDTLPVFGTCDELGKKTKKYDPQKALANCSNTNIQKFIAAETSLLKQPSNGETKKCFVRFVVNKEGKVINATIMKSSGDENLDKTAVEIINKMPTWQPGIQFGKPVEVNFIVPVTFQ